MQVHYGEGLANHTGPESCAVNGEVCGGTLKGERAGQSSSRETFLYQDAAVVTKTEGKTYGYGIASVQSVLCGHRTWHARTLLAWAPGDLQFAHSPARGGPRRKGEETGTSPCRYWCTCRRRRSMQHAARGLPQHSRTSFSSARRLLPMICTKIFALVGVFLPLVLLYLYFACFRPNSLPLPHRLPRWHG